MIDALSTFSELRVTGGGFRATTQFGQANGPNGAFGKGRLRITATAAVAHIIGASGASNRQTTMVFLSGGQLIVEISLISEMPITSGDGSTDYQDASTVASANFVTLNISITA